MSKINVTNSMKDPTPIIISKDLSSIGHEFLQWPQRLLWWWFVSLTNVEHQNLVHLASVHKLYVLPRISERMSCEWSAKFFSNLVYLHSPLCLLIIYTADKYPSIHVFGQNTCIATLSEIQYERRKTKPVTM